MRPRRSWGSRRAGTGGGILCAVTLGAGAGPSASLRHGPYVGLRSLSDLRPTKGRDALLSEEPPPARKVTSRGGGLPASSASGGMDRGPWNSRHKGDCRSSRTSEPTPKFARDSDRGIRCADSGVDSDFARRRGHLRRGGNYGRYRGGGHGRRRRAVASRRQLRTLPRRWPRATAKGRCVAEATTEATTDESRTANTAAAKAPTETRPRMRR